MLRNLSIAAAVTGLMLAPTFGFAATKHNHVHARASVHASRTHHAANHRTVHRTVTVRRNVNHRANRHVDVRRNVHVNIRVGGRYHGGVWYGHNRHYWRGRWYTYGVGTCWLTTPIGFVWVCGV